MSNADLNGSLGKPDVVLVGPPGIGASIDSLALSLTYLESKGIVKLGVVLNQVSDARRSEMAACVKNAVASHFSDVVFYGCLPTLAALHGGRAIFDVDTIADWIENNVPVDQMLFRN